MEEAAGDVELNAGYYYVAEQHKDAYFAGIFCQPKHFNYNRENIDVKFLLDNAVDHIHPRLRTKNPIRETDD
jgi:hypothetical protein